MSNTTEHDVKLYGHPVDLPRVALLIDGMWREGRGEVVTVRNPADEEVLLTFAAASGEDVDAAVASARRALEGEWGRTPGVERGRILNRLAELVERDAVLLARLEAIDIGKPVDEPAALDVPQTVATFRHFAGWADKIRGEAIPTAGLRGRPTTSFTLREPVGVIAAITPWNSPLMIASWKLGPALAAGNVVVLKPPEDAPLATMHLGALMLEAGLPPGVLNVVVGSGHPTGTALTRHPGVDKISFTGSPAVGRDIGVAAAQTFKRVTLELGGKSPQIVLADADVETAIGDIALGIFSNQGEICAAGSRVVVHRSLRDQVVEGLAAAAGSVVLGDPLDRGTTMGPVINAKQRDRVAGYIASGRTQGATVAAGGGLPDRSGYFVEPTVFTDVDNSMTIAQEEIFGPVVSAVAFDDPADAVRIANDTVYGLDATIWTRDVTAAHTLARQVRAGAVWINGWGGIDPALPWGGTKTSGVGRELGWSGILADTEEKVVTIVQ